MELKNISEKVISIGETVVMPDHVITISEEQAATPSIKALIRQGYIYVTAKKSTTGRTKQADVTKVADDTPNGGEAADDSANNADPPAETENPAEAETGSDKSAATKRGRNK